MYAQPAFSRQFWAHFVEHHWEKRPLLLKRPLPTLLATPREVFRRLVKASERYRADDQDVLLRFNVEHALQQAEIGKYLPVMGDRSWSGYAARIHQQLNGRQFALAVNEYHAHDPQTWLRLREFLRGLYDFIGIPVHLTEPILFLGDYDKTPSGIHKDTSSTFAFVIEGKRRLLAWPDEFFRGRPDSLDYERFRDQAITLEGEPGDILYWPSSYWHVGECVGGLSLTLNVAIWLKPGPSSDVYSDALRVVGKLLRASEGAAIRPFQPDQLKESARKLPPVLDRAITALAAASREPAFKQALMVAWLNRLASFGFQSVPPPMPRKRLKDDDVVRADPHYPILWLPAENNDIICSANGHAFALASHPKILELLARLNGGEPARVKSLVNDYRGTTEVDHVEFEASPKDIRALLEKLYSLRAITVSGSIQAQAGTGFGTRTAGRPLGL